MKASSRNLRAMKTSFRNLREIFPKSSFQNLREILILERWKQVLTNDDEVENWSLSSFLLAVSKDNFDGTDVT